MAFTKVTARARKIMWRKTLFLGAILSVVFVLPFMAGAATVTSAEFYGGYVEDLVIDQANGYGWAAFNAPRGLAYTADFVTWTGIDFDSGECTAVDADAEYVYAICGTSLYRTIDGSSWDTMALDNVNQYVHAGKDRTYVVMRETGPGGGMILAFSDDGGDTWTDDTEVSGVNNFLSMSSEGSTVYAIASVNDDYKLYKSIDSGLNWTDQGYTVPNGGNLSVAVSSININYVAITSDDYTYISTDGGLNFSDSGLNQAGEVLFVEKGVTSRLYSGVQYTDDLGAHWTTIEGGDVALGGNYIAVSGFKMLTDTLIGVAVSTDIGATWEEATKGLNFLKVYDIAQSSSDKDDVIIGLEGGMALSTNYTSSIPTWTHISDYDTATAVFYGNSLMLAGSWSKIYYSADSGTTWSTGGQEIGQITSFIRNKGVYYASSSNGVYSSVDGEAWTLHGLSGLHVNALAKTNKGLMYAVMAIEGETTTANLGIYKYNGTAWGQVVVDGVYNDVIVVDTDLGNNTVYAVSQPGSSELGGKVIRSTDYGTTWDELTVVSDGWYQKIVSQDNNGNVLYVSTGRPAGTGKIYKSLDAGDTWSLFYTGLKDEEFTAMFYDDLMVGSNAGLMSVNSEAKIKVTRTKKKVKSRNRSRLKVTLTDKDTNDALANRPVKLYYRYKATGTWKLLKQKKTGAKGKTNFNRRITKKTYFKVSWKPVKAAVKRTYGNRAFKALTNVKIK